MPERQKELCNALVTEIGKVVIGKEKVVRKILMAVCAGGHVLLEDMPGTGKTTLALAFAKATGLEFGRIQFTPDTMPSDIVGFSIYNKDAQTLSYRAGAADCNLLLADEINRTSPKTQAALLEVMEEGKATVDGIPHILPDPFICIATQNPYDSAGTQPLPDSQLDRFLCSLRPGYPNHEENIRIMREREGGDPLADINRVATVEDIRDLRKSVEEVHATDEIYGYIASLCEESHKDGSIRSGISPRGMLAVSKMARACAMTDGRDYVVPEDVEGVFGDVCAHRIILAPQVRSDGITPGEVLGNILMRVPAPNLGKKP